MSKSKVGIFPQLAGKNSKIKIGNIAAMAISSSIIGLGLEWCSEGCGVSIDELTEKITDFFYSGLQMKKESDQLIRLVKISNET